MGLYVTRRGRGPALALVHGFTQTGRCWGPAGDDLTGDHEVLFVDAPGHGGSAEVEAGLREGAALIGDAAGRATYLGYSMGGRFCLHLALARPELVTGLVLVGATAGIDDPTERGERVRRDEVTAGQIGELGLETFLDRWLAQSLFAGVPPERAFRTERMENTVAGLASSLRLAGTGAQEPLWDELARLDMPVLIVAGADDRKFRDLGERMAAAIGGNAAVALVAGCGHAAHLEDPDGFLAAVRPWLAAHRL